MGLPNIQSLICVFLSIIKYELVYLGVFFQAGRASLEIAASGSTTHTSCRGKLKSCE